MGKETVLSPSIFTSLVTDIQRLIDQRRERATAAANSELIRTYWAIGGRIAMENLTPNVGYEKAILGRPDRHINFLTLGLPPTGETKLSN